MNTKLRRALLAAVAGGAATLAVPAAATADLDPDYRGVGVIAVAYWNQCNGSVKVGIPNVWPDRDLAVEVNLVPHSVPPKRHIVVTAMPAADGLVTVAFITSTGGLDRATWRWADPGRGGVCTDQTPAGFAAGALPGAPAAPAPRNTPVAYAVPLLAQVNPWAYVMFALGVAFVVTGRLGTRRHRRRHRLQT